MWFRLQIKLKDFHLLNDLKKIHVPDITMEMQNCLDVILQFALFKRICGDLCETKLSNSFLMEAAAL